jgi:hypothetical protein
MRIDSLMDVEVSQHSVSVLSSMVIAQLPFPPMPICVVRGGEDVFCSSHDLMSSAMSVQACDALAGITPMNIDSQMATKANVLSTLQQAVAGVVDDMGTSDEAVERCYVFFQHAFRAYMHFYPCSPDMRFRPLCDVDPQSIVCVHAMAHLRGLAVMHGGDTVTVLSDRYIDMLRAYMCMLHAYGHADDEKII